MDRGHALLCRTGLVARRPCTLTLAPARRRLGLKYDLSDDAEQALRAAARRGLELYLYSV